MKIAIVVSHPVQHFCPWYASIANSGLFELEVFFASNFGAEPYQDEFFGEKLKWNNLYLDEFIHHYPNENISQKVDSDLDIPTISIELDSFGPDVVFIYGYWQKFQKRVIKWAEKNNKKIGYISDSELKRKRRLFVDGLKEIYLKYFFSKIDFFLVVGDSNATFYKNHGVSDSKLIYSPFPIDVKLYKEKKKNYDLIRNSVRFKYGIGPNDFVIATVGKAVSWKRPMDAVKLLIDLESKIDTNIYLIFIGSGPLIENLKTEAQKLNRFKLIFPGFISPENLPDYYAATDLYIHTAEYEPHSLAISEAIYMKCPIILSDRCGSYGLTDDVQLGLNGDIYKCGSIVDLTRQVTRLVNNSNLRDQYSNNSNKIAELKQEVAHIQCLDVLFNKMLTS